jgi:glycerol-3-phosphate dehydrogenase
VHVAIPWLKIRNDCTVTIPVPGRSRRATITRWGNVSYLGTTDEDYDGDLDNVMCTRQELDFLLEGARSALKTDLQPRTWSAASPAAGRWWHRPAARRWR